MCKIRPAFAGTFAAGRPGRHVEKTRLAAARWGEAGPSLTPPDGGAALGNGFRSNDSLTAASEAD